ncbi:MAG: hypothetical protein R3B82_23720 [Sandaracinaceae bacterium]
MRQNRKCPKCDGRTFYVVEKAKMSDGHSVNGTTPLALAAAYLTTEESGFFGTHKARFEAHVDAWICASCGFAELYARNLESLRELLDHGAEEVSFIDAHIDGEGAFR